MKEEDRPEKVLVVTITDGEDNSHLRGREYSRYTSDKVKEMVDHQTKNYKWDFAYIGANQDAWAVGSSMGVASNLNYSHTSAGTAYAFDNLARSTSNYRMSKSAKFAFEPDTEEDAKVKVQVTVNPATPPTQKV